MIFHGVKPDFIAEVGKLNIHEIAGFTRYAIATGIIESSVQVTILWRINRICE